MDTISKADYDSRINKIIEALNKTGKSITDLEPPYDGYFDIYGVWYFGLLKDVVRTIAKERFKVDLNNQMHVFIDSEPKKIADGIHDITAYGHSCRLYKWNAQGYHRGLVVLAEDTQGNADAKVYMDSGTWSWILK